MRRRQLNATVAGCVTALILAGCAVRGVQFSPEELELPPCEAGLVVPVERLDDEDRAPCDLDGSEVEFPDGRRVTVTQPGNITTRSWVSESSVSGFYTIFNMGVYGIVAVLTDRDRSMSTWWGPEDAIQMQKDITGEDWGD